MDYTELKTKIGTRESEIVVDAVLGALSSSLQKNGEDGRSALVTLLMSIVGVVVFESNDNNKRALSTMTKSYSRLIKTMEQRARARAH